jgi:hypothetical protein
MWSYLGAFVRAARGARPQQRVACASGCDHAQEKRMQIACMTTIVAAAVLLVLVDAHLRPGKEFSIAGSHTPDPPIRFTLRVNLPADVVRQVLDIPDTRAVERGAEHAPHRPWRRLRARPVTARQLVCYRNREARRRPRGGEPGRAFCGAVPDHFAAF